MPRVLTRVRLLFLAEQVNVWLRFGQPLREQIIDERCRQVWFTPHSVFGLVHWQANRYGTIDWWLAVLRAVAPGEPAQSVSHVAPGAEILLQVRGGGRVRQVLQLIDDIEAQSIKPFAVSSPYWRTVHNRLAAHQEPPPYCPEQHLAHLRRRDLTR